MPHKKSIPDKPEKKRSGKKKKSNLHPHAVISGYYGFDNLGDELILKVLTDELKAHQIEITVLSNNPAKTAKEYGVNAIKRTSFIDIVDVLARANLFISGGGGLFQDATGPMSTLYYGGLIHLASFFEVPVCFWAQGVGPLRKNLSRKMTASALKKCEAVTIRDEGSKALVQEISGITPEMTADPVWLLKLPKASGKGKDKESAPWRIGVSLRTWPDLTPKRIKTLAECLNTLAQNAARPVEFALLPFQEKEDLHLLNDLMQHLGPHPDVKNAEPVSGKHRVTCTIIEPEDVLQGLTSCDVIFGMRFHSLILGILANIPVYGIIYDPKVAALLKMFDLQGTPVDTLETITPLPIQDYLDHYPAIDLKPLKKEAQRNFTILNNLLNIPDAELVR